VFWSLLLCALWSCNGAEPPKDFDCKMRQLAADYAFKLQPFRGRREFQELVDSLNMHGGSPGGEAQCFETKVPDMVPEEFNPKFTLVDGQVVFVVAVDGDDQNGAGSLGKPFATIHRAVEETRKVRNGTAQSFTVAIRGGRYYMSETIVLGPDDVSITFQNYNGEKVWLSGARRVGNDAKLWKKSNLNEDVWELDLSHLDDLEAVNGLRLDGKRAVRARYPNGCTSEKPLPSGYKCMGYQRGKNVVHPADGFGTNLLGKWVRGINPSMNQSNWTMYEPESPQRKIGKHYNKFTIGIGGTCTNKFWPPAGYWCGTGGWGGAPSPPNEIVIYPRGVQTDVLPNYPYGHPGDAIVQSWRPGHWASWMFKVSDASNATHLMFENGGFQGGRGEATGEGFFVENVEEELDADNEYFYNPRTKILKYHSSSGQPPANVEAVELKTFFALRGSQEKPVTGIHFLGLGFRDSHYTYMDAHQMPAGGDWGISLRAGIEARGVEKVVIDSCTFEEMDGNVLLVKGYARDVLIQNSDFHLIGGNMIGLLGETESPTLPKEWGFGFDGTAGNQPRGTIVRSNFAYRCGLFPKQSSFFFQSKSMETTIQNNIFFHGPRAGINLNDGFGGGNLLEGNLMFATVMETGDHGPVNTWDRQPYAHRKNEDGSFRMEKDKDDELRNNFMVGNYYTQSCVDNDDGSQHFNTHHNFFVYGDQGMKSDFDGHSNHQHNNLYAFLNTKAVDIMGSPLKGQEDHFYNNSVIQKHGTRYLKYDCKLETPDAPVVIAHDNKLYTDSGIIENVCNRTIEDRAKDVDKGTTVQKWPSVDEIIKQAKSLLGMEDEVAPIFINSLSS